MKKNLSRGPTGALHEVKTGLPMEFDWAWNMAWGLMRAAAEIRFGSVTVEAKIHEGRVAYVTKNVTKKTIEEVPHETGGDVPF
jgi:hypothetical protein